MPRGGWRGRVDFVLVGRILDVAEEQAQQEAAAASTGRPRTLTLLQVLRAHDALLAGAAPSWVQQGGYHRLFLKMALDPEPSWPLKAARMEQVPVRQLYQRDHAGHADSMVS